MQRVAFACAAFSFAILPSPLDAQAGPEQPPPAIQTAPPALPAVPPALPPMPSARPTHRWVDTGDHHTAGSHHHSTRAIHPATHKRHATAKHHATSKHRATHGHHRATHASKQTIRKCHSMTYEQIVRHSSCRALMKQDLETAEHRHRHASRQHGPAHHHKSAHHHSSAHHHGS